VIELTRRYGFPAAHVLRQPSLSPEENLATYGKCANPNGHGHNYEVEVTVTGPIDERTGRILSPDLLDRIFEERVESRLLRGRVVRISWSVECLLRAHPARRETTAGVSEGQGECEHRKIPKHVIHPLERQACAALGAFR